MLCMYVTFDCDVCVMLCVNNKYVWYVCYVGYACVYVCMYGRLCVLFMSVVNGMYVSVCSVCSEC